MVRGRVGVTMSSTMSPLKLGVCGEFDALESNTSPERCMNHKLILTAVKACSSEVLTHIVSYAEGKQPPTTTYTAHIPAMAQSLSDSKNMLHLHKVGKLCHRQTYYMFWREISNA